MQKTQFLHAIGRLPFGALLVFGIKQAWAALFGGLMLFVLVLTAYVDLPLLMRYDWLFIAAIAIQLCMLAAKLEKPHEVITIMLFHLVGLGMELFKTSGAIGSWSYPGDAFFKLGNVPLFSGFMYAAVGSYMARSWRVMELEFSKYPNRIATAFLAVGIYANFFTHHFFYDIRYFLFLAILLLFGRTWVTYTINTTVRRMPLVMAFVLIAFFIWLAENIATYVNVWLYPHQVGQWEMVGLEKLGSWLLLMVISFVMVDLLHYLRSRKHRALP
ncbi:MAG TPA: DUF817 domain-containing protein [Candidatus Saccharimonadales bacterium]|nr:DUF817 domain-containing protein [Candidatus Saccharimonadales bacterium]